MTAINNHSFARDGSRTVRKWRIRQFVIWIEESAAWHIAGHASRGVTFDRGHLWISAGRYSINVWYLYKSSEVSND